MADLQFRQRDRAIREVRTKGRPPLTRLIGSVLLDDQAVVPTQHMLSATGLVGTIGESAVRALLQMGHLKFVRFKGALCYLGNGHGIQSYVLGGEGREVLPPWTPLGEALAWAVGELHEKPKDPRFQ